MKRVTLVVGLSSLVLVALSLAALSISSHVMAQEYDEYEDGYSEGYEAGRDAGGDEMDAEDRALESRRRWVNRQMERQWSRSFPDYSKPSRPLPPIPPPIVDYETINAQARAAERALDNAVLDARLSEPIYRYVDGTRVRAGGRGVGGTVVVPSGGTIYQYVDGPAVAGSAGSGTRWKPVQPVQQRPLVVPGGWTVGKPHVYGRALTAEEIVSGKW